MKKKIYYIIEGTIKYTDSKKNIIGSVINTMIRDDIKIFFTKDITDTYNLLLNIISRITKEPEKYLNVESAEIPVKKHSTGGSSNSIYKNMLCQIPGISNKAADAIIAVYPTFNLLYSTLEKLEDSEKLKLLKEIKQDSSRKISGSALNNILVNLFT